jgi:hypothetical protein
MFDFTGWEKTNDSAYIYRGFLSDSVCDLAFQQSVTAQKEGDYNENPRNRGILLLGVPMLNKVVDAVKKIFENTEYEVNTFLHWYTVDKKPFGIHSDDQAYDPHPNKKTFGGVIYLSEMDGGALYYPETNTWMQPHKGDLVLQSSAVLHGAEPISGDNKRTVTFVVYDKTQPGTNWDQDEYLAWRNKTIKSSKEWLDSEIGKRWAIDWPGWANDLLKEEKK